VAGDVSVEVVEKVVTRMVIEVDDSGSEVQ